MTEHLHKFQEASRNFCFKHGINPLHCALTKSVFSIHFLHHSIWPFIMTPNFYGTKYLQIQKSKVVLSYLIDRRNAVSAYGQMIDDYRNVVDISWLNYFVDNSIDRASTVINKRFEDLYKEKFTPPVSLTDLNRVLFVHSCTLYKGDKPAVLLELLDVRVSSYLGR